MNPFEMVVLIVAITAIASMVRARYGMANRHKGEIPGESAAAMEALRCDIRQLKERVAVLERLATDSSSALDREFEKLKRQD